MRRGRPNTNDAASCLRLLDRPAAEDEISVVEHDGLPGRDRPLRLIENKPHARTFKRPGRGRFFALAISHSFVPGLVSRAWKIEKILHRLQTGYGKNPCKGFGG